MKKVILRALTAAFILSACTPNEGPSAGYPITPVPFTSVKVENNSFWGQRLEASRKVTIPLAFSKCESEGRYTNFSNAAERMKDSTKVFKVHGRGFSFDDTDPYKTIEGASYILQTYPDERLKLYIDSVLAVIASAQEPDGYLYTARTQNPEEPHHWAGPTRWSKVEDLSHEFYNLGHMAESAVAHYQATGERTFLDIATRYADCIIREVGDQPGQACLVPGHQIAEMALCKLYLVTGERKYLDQAKFFLDYRGKTSFKTEYSQSHKPVVEQDEAVGHAVRAAYMYAGMADVAALTGDSAYIKAIDAIWENIVSKKLYITGGIGATNHGEAFGPNYYLPNMSAYCETCAAIGNVYVNHRLFLLHGESKYYDVLERTLYNGLLSGVSLDGGKFFYPNPLESAGQHQRQAWFGCACCPSNICRFIPSLPGYVYAVKDRDVYVNLFLSNSATLNVDGKKVSITQTTDYPYGDSIRIKIDENRCEEFTLKVRIPGWVEGTPVPSDLYSYTKNWRLEYGFKFENPKEGHLKYTFFKEGPKNIIDDKKTFKETFNETSQNGRTNAYFTPDGYLNITRKWKKGDEVTVFFKMRPRVVLAHENVEADRGLVAIERGPLVYCAEWADNDFDIKNVVINPEAKFTLGERDLSTFIPEERKSQLTTWSTQHITTLSTEAQVTIPDAKGEPQYEKVHLTLTPYYTWAHRGRGDMKVWLPCSDKEE
ncbi:MAG: glycoside hydrolase family 127 protein [Bacteroidaceae bacterium]|nr:glycoside hydrolase family 127 protein [Bacteroidaceae bacterium]